ncbi:MAG TPA: DUF1501 domain-containing protein [Polyangiales bacterium]|nr:DUF1501 domain-containing protein [Polyangiales bacterium]
MDLTRRRFLIASGCTAATFMVDFSPLRAQEGCTPSKLPLVITVQASGAWDPTFLVDPVADDARFTPFSAAHIKTVGQIRYAPYDITTGVVQYNVGATPTDFFAKHGQRLLVWNGVDNATVSHDVGPRVAFTGSTRDGLPTLSGLVAGLQGADLPLAMFVSGGFASTGGLVPITRGGSLTLLRNLASPNRDGIHPEAIDVKLRDATRARDARLIAATSLPRANKAFTRLLGFRSGAIEDRFREIADVLQAASETRPPAGFADAASGMLALMRAGATAAGHLSTAGFDTHDNHDDLNNGHRPALQRLLTGLDYIIDTAAADPTLTERGVLILVGSDFGRTTYNDGGGKDHWPITSMMAIGIGPKVEALIGGARVIGATTPTGQNGMTALPVKIADGKTVVAEEGEPGSFKLTPAHVNYALRSAIGLCETNTPNDPLRRFRFNVSPQEPLPLKS